MENLASLEYFAYLHSSVLILEHGIQVGWVGQNYFDVLIDWKMVIFCRKKCQKCWSCS